MNMLVRKTLDVANSQEGVREQGSNRGPQVEAYLQSTNTDPGEPWCASFVYWCINQASKELGVKAPFLLTDACRFVDQWARRRDILDHSPQPGDVFLLYEASEASHTGFVNSADQIRYGTIEGNTNLDGSPEGIGVFKRNRPVNAGVRFVHWERLASEMSETLTLILSGQPIVEMPVRRGIAFCPVRKWGEALGFTVEWSQEKQLPLLDGNVVPTQIVLIGNTAYAPIRDLVESAGLRLDLDLVGHKVLVKR